MTWLPHDPMRLRYLTTCLDGRRIPLNVEERAEKKGDYPYWGANGIVDYLDEYLFDEPLVLLGEDGAPFFDPLKPKAFFISNAVWVNNHIHVLRPKSGVNGRYLAYALNSVDYSQYIEGSTRDKLTQDEMKDIRVLIPDNEYQQEFVANYLDRETAHIDALIAEKERMLALLEEKRAALISQAVTRGLDPDAPLKPSGLDWLGDIPAHWETRRGKYLFSQSALPVRDDDEIVTCFRDGMVTLRRNRREEGFTNAVLELGYQGIREGQLVLHSMDAFAGAIGISDSDGKCSPEYIICNPITEGVVSAYFGVLLRLMALRGYIQAACPAVRERAPRIRFSHLSNMFLPFPPAEEQLEVVNFLKDDRDKTVEIENALKTSISLLKERRSALITAAVTGQIDPKDMAA